jgi:hypothetical protein
MGQDILVQPGEKDYREFQSLHGMDRRYLYDILIVYLGLNILVC